MTILALIVYVLACARVTRLINADTILDAPRLAIARRSHDTDSSQAEQRRWAWLLYFVSCPWCVGFWICLAGAYPVVRIIGWPWWAVFSVGLAASHLVGVFSFAADTEDVAITAVEDEG